MTGAKPKPWIGEHGGRREETRRRQGVRFSSSFTDDKFDGETFDCFRANPTFGVDWKKQRSAVKHEYEKWGFEAMLPRENDGSLLFLQPITGLHLQRRPSRL